MVTTAFLVNLDITILSGANFGAGIQNYVWQREKVVLVCLALIGFFKFSEPRRSVVDFPTFFGLPSVGPGFCREDYKTALAPCQ